MPNPKPDTLPGSSRDAIVQQKLESLKKEYAELHKKKITTEANINNLEESLAKLQTAAEKEYGTSDLDKLKEILEMRRRENEAKVAAYEKHIQEIQDNLATIATDQGEED